MLYSLKGELIHADPRTAVIDCGGVILFVLQRMGTCFGNKGTKDNQPKFD